MKINFYKYQGTGNDFIMIDNRNRNLHEVLSQTQIDMLCNRHTGIGADGLILLTESENTDFRMIYYNADGRQSSMCGNGGRCITAFALQMGIQKLHYRFEAIDGIHEAQIENGLVHLKMGKPHGFTLFDNNNMWINTGSPHYVQLSDTPVEQLAVKKLGAEIRYNKTYESEGTNVNFVNILDKNTLKVRTYERGVEDETLSCGTGATACAYTYMLWNNHISTVDIHTPGGLLQVKVIHFQEDNEEIWLTGPAVFVFSGEITLDSL